MSTYTVTNTAGNTVTTISVGTTTGSTYPIEMVGQGYSQYGQIIATTQYKLMENFAAPTPPTIKVDGMHWYDTTNKQMNYYNGSSFITLGSGTTNSGSMFPMLASAKNISLATTGTTIIFTNPNTGNTFHATGILLKPVGTPTASTAALINLYVASSEDVLETVSVLLHDASRHSYYNIQGTTHTSQNTESITLEVSNAATGGTLVVDAYLFGFMT